MLILILDKTPPPNSKYKGIHSKFLLLTLNPPLPMMMIAQSCPTLQPVDSSLPGSSVHGILQAGILEWVAISFCRGSSRPRD